MCTNMQECTCVSSRISVCGERCVRHVYMNSLCPWFRITVSRNSCLECVNQAAGVSLDQCVSVLWACACRYTGVCTQLHWRVTGVWAQEGLKSSLFKTPLSRRPDRLRMEAAHSKCKARGKRTLVGLAGNRCPNSIHQPWPMSTGMCYRRMDAPFIGAWTEGERRVEGVSEERKRGVSRQLSLCSVNCFVFKHVLCF